MSPDSPETRISRLEQQMARVEQRLDDWLRHVQEDVRDLTVNVADLRKEIEAREEARRNEVKQAQKERDRRREVERADSQRERKALYTGMALVVMTTLGGFIVNLIAQAHP